MRRARLIKKLRFCTETTACPAQAKCDRDTGARKERLSRKHEIKSTAQEGGLQRDSIPSKPWFFQASSFQVRKSENLPRWSFYTFIFNRSLNQWIISYILHIISLLTGRCELNKLTPLTVAPNVCFHGSVSGASHWYSRRSRVRIPLKPWYFQASFQ